MRIGIDATSLPVHLAGAGRYIMGLIHGLSQLESSHEYVIFCKQRDRHRFQELPPRFSISCIPDLTRPARIYWQLCGLPDDLQRHHLDLWHATHYTLPVVNVGCLVMVTIHDLAFFRFPHFYSLQKRAFFRWIIRQAVRRADAIIAVSQSTKRDILQFFPHAAPVHSVYSGVDPAFFADSNGTPPPYHRDYLLAVGTQERRKNLPFLIDLFSRLAPDFPDLDLLLIGQPENDTSRILETIRRCRLSHRVRWYGFVPESHLAAYYRHARALVHPAHYEGFGFPILEAMASCLPVVASDRPSINEIGRKFVCLASNEAQNDWEMQLQNLLQNKPPHDLLQAAQAYARRFDWRHTAQQVESLYEHYHDQWVVRRRRHFLPASERTAAKKVLIGSTSLETAVLKTLSFASLFRYPLQEQEILGGLLEAAASPEELRNALQRLLSAGKVQKDNEFYYLPGESHFVALRRKRQDISQSILERNRRWLTWVAHFPGVEAVALSGTLAFANCESTDDLDLFVITQPRRLWLTYLCLAILLKLCRRRRLLCLNYLVARDADPPVQQNLFVAHQIVHLRPVFQPQTILSYQESQPWTRSYLPQGGMGWPLRFAIPERSLLARLLHESWRLLPLGWLDRLCYQVYGYHIRRITASSTTADIRIDRGVIQLFTNNHLESVMQRFHEKFTRTLNHHTQHREEIREAKHP